MGARLPVVKTENLFPTAALAMADIYSMLEGRQHDEWSKIWDILTPDYWRRYWLRAAGLSEVHAACRWRELSQQSRDQIKAAQRMALQYLVGEG